MYINKTRPPQPEKTRELNLSPQDIQQLDCLNEYLNETEKQIINEEKEQQRENKRKKWLSTL